MNLCSASLPVFLFFAGIAARAQDITIRAVDGKTGQHLTNVRLVVSAFNDISERMGPDSKDFDLRTDRNGIATFPSSRIGKAHLQIWVDFKTQCVDNPNAVAISVNEILSSGVTEKNSCSKKIHAKTVPGTLTIYAREATLMEKLAR